MPGFGEYAENVRYLMFPVAKEDGELTVAGNPVSEAGWYTFRQRFMDEGGNLAVDFQLVRDGEALFTQDVTTTGLSEEELSSFEATNVGNGYAWFVSISEGLGVAIDEQRLVVGEAAQVEPAALPETGARGAIPRSWRLVAIGGALLVLMGLGFALLGRGRRAGNR